MIGHAIAAAAASGLFGRIIVSTDSQRIAEAAEASGAEVPFRRPAELADDHTPTAPVLVHALRWLEENGDPAEYACCIYATVPFLKPEFLVEGYETMVRSGASSVFSVTTFPFSIFRALRVDERGRLAMFWPEHELKRSQDLPEAYHDAGQFYWLHVDAFLKSPRVYTPDAMPVVLPRHCVQDIDTEEDWMTAERMQRARDVGDGRSR